MERGLDGASTFAGEMHAEGMIKEKNVLKKVALEQWLQKDKKETPHNRKRDYLW